jgi:hypothetical protein
MVRPIAARPLVKMDKTGRNRLTGRRIPFSVDKWEPFGARLEERAARLADGRHFGGQRTW